MKVDHALQKLSNLQQQCRHAFPTTACLEHAVKTPDCQPTQQGKVSGAGCEALTSTHDSLPASPVQSADTGLSVSDLVGWMALTPARLHV